MAVVKAPALSLDASGNLGAICYSGWRGMNIARSVWTGTDPNTGLQQAQRAITKSVVQAWGGTLVAGMREAWNAVAQSQVRMNRVKTSYIPTGFQFFTELNIQRLRLGGALMLIPPAAIDPYTWQTFRLGYDYYNETVNLHFEDELNPGAPEFSAEFCRAGPYDSGGRHALDGEYRFQAFIQPIGTETDPGMTIGKWYWYRARVMDDYGRPQGWFEEQILIPTQESGQIILNSEFDNWTADDPDDWLVQFEDADNKVTEAVTGAKIIGIIGGHIVLRQAVSLEVGMKYTIEITNTRTLGNAQLHVYSSAHYYVSGDPINVNIYTTDFTVLPGFTSVVIFIYKADGHAINTIMVKVKLYPMD